MDCPRCGGPTTDYTLGGRSASVCEDCGYVGVDVDHGSEVPRRESWTDAIRRFHAGVGDDPRDGDASGDGGDDGESETTDEDAGAGDGTDDDGESETADEDAGAGDETDDGTEERAVPEPGEET